MLRQDRYVENCPGGLCRRYVHIEFDPGFWASGAGQALARSHRDRDLARRRRRPHQTQANGVARGRRPVTAILRTAGTFAAHGANAIAGGPTACPRSHGARGPRDRAPSAVETHGRSARHSTSTYSAPRPSASASTLSRTSSLPSNRPPSHGRTTRDDDGTDDGRPGRRRRRDRRQPSRRSSDDVRSAPRTASRAAQQVAFIESPGHRLAHQRHVPVLPPLALNAKSPLQRVLKRPRRATPESNWFVARNFSSGTPALAPIRPIGSQRGHGRSGRRACRTKRYGALSERHERGQSTAYADGRASLGTS